MPWISINTDVKGGRLRVLAKELETSQEEALGILASLWLWGIKEADRTGTFREDALDAEEIFSKAYADGHDIGAILKAMEAGEWVKQIEPGVYQFVGWSDYQEGKKRTRTNRERVR